MAFRRETFRKKAANFLNLDEENLIVLNMEKGVFNNAIQYCKENGYPLKWSDYNFSKNYATNARKILANISYTTNAPVLKEKIKDGMIEPYNLVKMSREELNPDVWENLKTKTLNKVVVKQLEQEDGIFKCNKCKSMKTVYYQMQTRSADEPMTTYVTCTNCNFKWKC
jgi:DNA-directed RNA polymerase subunit M/transcription elongation factor TFIIS